MSYIYYNKQKGVVHIMVHLTKEFFTEVELLKVINLSHRNMHWEIVPKEKEYTDWGDELYTNSYRLMLIDDSNETEKFPEIHIQDFKKEKYNINIIRDDIECEYVRQHNPEIEITDETEIERYIPEDENLFIQATAHMIANRNIATYIVEKTRQNSNVTNNEIIKIYAGEQLLIMDNPEEKDEDYFVPDETKNLRVLEALYFYVPSVAMTDLNDAVKNKDISHITKNEWLKNLLHLVESKQEN